MTGLAGPLCSRFADTVALELRRWRVEKEGILRMRTTFGILAGMIGVGAWLWMRGRTADQSASGSGRVIYRNTPEPTALSGEGII